MSPTASPRARLFARPMMRMMWVCLSIAGGTAAAHAQPAPADPPTYVGVFDVRDLVIAPPDYPLNTDVHPITRAVGNSGNSVGGGAQDNVGAREKKDAVSRQDRVDSLVKLLQEAIAPDTWREAGGTLGSIREFDGSLIITQTAENHKAIEEVLDLLRSQRHRTVTVQAYWVVLSHAELDAVTRPLPVASRPALRAGREAKNDAGPDIKPANPAAARPDGKSADGKGADAKGPAAAPARPRPDDEVDSALMVADVTAIEKLPGRAVRYRARTAGFNGQMVHVSSGDARTIVIDQTPVVGNGIMGYQPGVSIVQDGASLEISPLLTAGDRAAIVDVSSVVSTWDATEASRPQAVVTTQPVLGDTPATFDKVRMHVHQMRTTVAVPLGKPILLGGMTFKPPAADPRAAARPTTRPADDDAEPPQLYLIMEVRASKAEPPAAGG